MQKEGGQFRNFWGNMAGIEVAGGKNVADFGLGKEKAGRPENSSSFVTFLRGSISLHQERAENKTKRVGCAHFLLDNTTKN